MNFIFYPLIIILGFLSSVVGIWQFFVYIKLSWARRNNSKNFNGLQTSEAIFEKLGDDIKVEKSFWSLTYVRYSKAKKTLKLGAIDSRRSSIWTVATSGRQAYSAHIIERATQGKKPPINLLWFKLQTFWFGLFMSMLFNIGIIISFSLWASSMNSGGEIFGLWFWVFLTIILFVPLLYAIASFKTSKLMLENIDKIFGNIFSKEEVNQIRSLWKLEYINSIIELIKIVVVIVFTLMKAIVVSKQK
ncbi:MAG: hypothetical protein HRS50_01540 [Mycoplasmataceae bacterium]|nr:hypothetical protein [Mycoplasmataceae bacterium]